MQDEYVENADITRVEIGRILNAVVESRKAIHPQ
jgi:hypothetical protein